MNEMSQTISFEEGKPCPLPIEGHGGGLSFSPNGDMLLVASLPHPSEAQIKAFSGKWRAKLIAESEFPSIPIFAVGSEDWLLETPCNPAQQEKEALEVTNAKLDISLYEQSILQDELVETRKLSALGMMVAGVAHELNTPVGGALMLTSTLETHLTQLTKAVDTGLSRQALADYILHSQEGLKLLDENLKRAKIRVESFKRLAIDRASDDIVEFRLRQVCDDLLRSLQVMLTHSGVKVVTHIAEDLRLVGYPGIVSQILQNLIVNAVVHGFADMTGGQIELRAETNEQDQVILRVSDNGSGVRSDIAGRMFDPFVTSARGQGSSGLGLHLVHQWVTRLLHGSIRAEEPAEGGLSFLIVFPRHISAD